MKINLRYSISGILQQKFSNALMNKISKDVTNRIKIIIINNVFQLRISGLIDSENF